MSGQGKTIRAYAETLSNEGWTVIYVCVPNTVHVGVVPIMTSHGVSKQRYPDIVALRGNTLLLVEVEMTLTEAVTQDILLRFQEMRDALSNGEIYRAWASKIEMSSGVTLPPFPIVETRLLVVKGLPSSTESYVNRLIPRGVIVISGVIGSE